MHAVAANALVDPVSAVNPAAPLIRREVTPADRLGLTVFLAVVAHLLVILGISFSQHARQPARDGTLDVVLVQVKTEETVEDAKLLAQANQEGGGEEQSTQRPATPVQAPLVSRQANLAAADLPSPLVEAEPSSSTRHRAVQAAARRRGAN